MKTVSERAQALRDKIEATHDMRAVRQVWQWEACGVQGKEACTICGLTHSWWSGGQNSPDKDEYADSRGQPLTLAEAARAECE